jgi:hypothetical protein
MFKKLLDMFHDLLDRANHREKYIPVVQEYKDSLKSGCMTDFGEWAHNKRRDEFQLPLRIAIVSNPRSGNTWVRRLLAFIYSLEELAVHNPQDVDWTNLPERFVLQVHYHYEETFVALLEQYQFHVIVISRHPLDTLVSILHFAPHEPATARWLDGEGGNEKTIIGVSPCSPEFLEYATGPRSLALLSISREWWLQPGILRLRYEDLVLNPVLELARLGVSLRNPTPSDIIDKAVAAHSIEELRKTASNQHFWLGQPGHWKKLLPASLAYRIALTHSQSFDMFGYEVTPDPTLDKKQAVSNWETDLAISR